MKKFSIKQLLLYLTFLLFILYGPIYRDISVDELKVDYTNKYSKFINVDDLQVHYRIEGEGTPIVLIHGTASSLHTWDAWTAELKKTNKVIRMDLPAFGLTGPNATADYSIKSYTNFLHKFLTVLVGRGHPSRGITARKRQSMDKLDTCRGPR